VSEFQKKKVIVWFVGGFPNSNFVNCHAVCWWRPEAQHWRSVLLFQLNFVARLVAGSRIPIRFGFTASWRFSGFQFCHPVGWHFSNGSLKCG